MYLVDTLPHCLAVDPICCIRSTCINEQKLLCVALKNSFNVILRDFKSGIMCKVLTCHPSKLLDMMVMKRVKYALFMVDMFRNYILFCILFKSIKKERFISQIRDDSLYTISAAGILQVFSIQVSKRMISNNYASLNILDDYRWFYVSHVET